jgi:hypothetical protein
MALGTTTDFMLRIKGACSFHEHSSDCVFLYFQGNGSTLLTMFVWTI